MSRVVIFQGSARSAQNCPGQWGKTSRIVQDCVQRLQEAEHTVDIVDLAVTDSEHGIIRPCKACVSTAGGYHCHWKCDCYGPESAIPEVSDFMHDRDIYNKLEACDAFVVATPVNWYGPSTQVKAMFDRLVCANLTLTTSAALKVLGPGNLKNPGVTRVADKQRKADHLLKNHLAGRLACFIIHGDAGADDYERAPAPPTYSPAEEPEDPRVFIMPLVWQCRYSGIEVPDELIIGGVLNIGHSYAEANDMSMPPFYAPAVTALIDRLRTDERTSEAAGQER